MIERTMHKFTALAVTILALLALPSSVSADDPAQSLLRSPYGTFETPQNAIDGNPATVCKTKLAWQGEFFLIMSKDQDVVINEIKADFKGPQPPSVIWEISRDAASWKPLVLGGGAGSKFVRIRFSDDAKAYAMAEITASAKVSAPLYFTVLESKVVSVDTNNARLMFKFNKPARVQISYGPRSSDLDHTSDYTSYLEEYDITLDKLGEGLTYFTAIRITSDEGEHVAMVGGQSLIFTTLGTPPLQITTIAPASINPLDMTITLNTNIPSHATFYFGSQSAFYHTQSSRGFDTHHLFKVGELRPNEVYTYMLMMTDMRGQTLTTEKYHVSSAEINIARGRRVIEGTFTHLENPGAQMKPDDPPPLQRLTDDNTSYFSGLARSGDISDADQFAVIDLEREYIISSIGAAWRELSYPELYEIYTSTDAQQWRQSGTFATRKNVQARTSDGSPMIITGGALSGPPRARYIKLVIPKNTRLFSYKPQWRGADLIEIKVFPGGGYDDIVKIVEQEKSRPQ